MTCKANMIVLKIQQKKTFFWANHKVETLLTLFFFDQAIINQPKPQAQPSDEPLAAKRPRLPTPPPTLAAEPPALSPDLVTPYLPSSITPNTSTAPCLTPVPLTVPSPQPEPSETYTHSSSYVAYMESLLNSDFPEEGDQGSELMY